MIKSELTKILNMEQYIESITLDEVEKMCLKQDFYQFSTFQKEPLFDSWSRPEDKIYSLLDDHEEGSYDQLQVIQHKMKCLKACKYEETTDQKLRSWYLNKRKQIVESGMTVAEIQNLLSNTPGFNSDNQHTRMHSVDLQFVSPSLRNQKYKFLWEFLDALLQFSGSSKIKQYQGIYCQQSFNKVEEKQMSNQKLGNESSELINLYRKLLALIQRDHNQALIKLITESEKIQSLSKFK